MGRNMLLFKNMLQSKLISYKIIISWSLEQHIPYSFQFLTTFAEGVLLTSLTGHSKGWGKYEFILTALFIFQSIEHHISKCTIH